MRRFIGTGDWHIQIKKGISSEWQINRYKELEALLIDLCERCNAGLIITGDVFERREPELEEQRIVFSMLRHFREAGIEVFMISGNHETIGPGLDTFQYLDTGKLKTLDVHYAPREWSIGLKDANTTLSFLNHCSLSDIPEPLNKSVTNILITHVRGDVNEFIRAETDIEELTERFDLCIAGDIHLNYEQGKVVYTNQPLNSVFEAKPECGVVLLEIKDGKVEWKRIPTLLPNLIQVSCKAEDFPPELDDYNFFRIDVAGSMAELRGLKSELPNVKVVKVPEVQETFSEDYTENVSEETTDKSLTDGLSGYLENLAYPKQQINRLMEVWEEAA